MALDASQLGMLRSVFSRADTRVFGSAPRASGNSVNGASPRGDGATVAPSIFQ
jgi:hypothetical protein